MKDSERYKLLHGPYAVPRVQKGDEMLDVVRGEYVRVGGYTAAPISWPRLRKNGRASLIVTEELARAVRHESEIAISHHWGVGVVTIWSWRKALGVPRVNEGTQKLYEGYSPEKLPEWVAAEGRANAATKEHSQASADRLRGKPAHPVTAEALRKSASKRKPKAHRENIGKSQERYWLSLMEPLPQELVRAVVEYRKVAPAPSPGVRWHQCEEAVLGKGPDRVIAALLGRTRASVTLHRTKLGIPAFASAFKRCSTGRPPKI
jgi:hypothetical protein